MSRSVLLIYNFHKPIGLICIILLLGYGHDNGNLATLMNSLLLEGWLPIHCSSTSEERESSEINGILNMRTISEGMG
jgi:hypothetical protein